MRESLAESIIRIWKVNPAIRTEFRTFPAFAGYMENCEKGCEDILKENSYPGDSRGEKITATQKQVNRMLDVSDETFIKHHNG